MGCASSRAAGASAPAAVADCLPSNVLRVTGYDEEEKLGEGAFGEVVRVTHQDSDNEYACKKLKAAVVKELGALQTEVHILKACRHANIVFLREVLLNREQQVFLVLELARGGSLYERIMEEDGLHETYAASVVIQLSAALEYLHGRAIVHRDMKPENVLLLDTSGRSLVKLCDFGLSKVVRAAPPPAADLASLATPVAADARPEHAHPLPTAATRADLMKSRVGSLVYASPELLKEEDYTASVDLWGLGHILYMALSGMHPFEHSLDVYGDITSGSPTSGYRHEAWQKAPEAERLCRTLLCADPAARPTPKEVLAHPWLKTVSNDRRTNLSLRYLGRVASIRGVCLRALEACLNDEQRSALQSQFDRLDSDAKGYLNAADVRRALKPGKRRRSKHKQRDKAKAKAKGASDWASSGRETEESVDAPAAEPDGVEAARAASSADLRASAGRSPSPPSSARGELNVTQLLQRLLTSALADSGVGKKHAKERGHSADRPTRGARRVGVVSFSMFAEAALEVQPGLVRRLWADAFARLDPDGDGIVGEADLLHCLERLGIDLGAEDRRGLLSDVEGRTSSRELLRLTLDVRGEEARANGAKDNASR